VHLEAFEASLL